MEAIHVLIQKGSRCKNAFLDEMQSTNDFCSVWVSSSFWRSAMTEPTTQLNVVEDTIEIRQLVISASSTDFDFWPDVDSAMFSSWAKSP